MKLNDTVYKKYIVPSQEFTLYSTSLLLSDYIDDSKQVTEGFYLQCLGTTK
jgi:hypothetical protein